MGLNADFINRRELVMKMIRNLTASQRQKFYEELGRWKVKGVAEEEAIAKAFQRIGLENPFNSMKITIGKQTLFGIRKGHVSKKK